MNLTLSKLRILIVEDDPRMLELLCQGLREIGHTVMPASDGQAGHDLALKFDFDTVVLDIGLPYRDGYEVALALRSEKKTVPILMLTARDAEDDIIRGFDMGADDYLIKPFSFPELVARLQGLTRLSRREVSSASLVLDHARLTVLRENDLIQLTRTEFLLLQVLAEQTGTAVSRQHLIESIWGTHPSVHANNLDVLVNALRAKLDAPYKIKMIMTLRGLGYRLEGQAERPKSTSQLSDSLSEPRKLSA